MHFTLFLKLRENATGNIGIVVLVRYDNENLAEGCVAGRQGIWRVVFAPGFPLCDNDNCGNNQWKDPLVEMPADVTDSGIPYKTEKKEQTRSNAP